MEEDYEKILGQVKKPRKNSRTKGAANERSLCKALEEWTGQAFARIPSSGGLRWKDGQNIVGDLVCVDPNFVFPFSVETKHYANVTCVVKNRFLSPTCTMYKIWMQACRDAERESKIPICFIKTNKQRGWTVYLSKEAALKLKLASSLLSLNAFVDNMYTIEYVPTAVTHAWEFVTLPSHKLFQIPFGRFITNYKINYARCGE